MLTEQQKKDQLKAEISLHLLRALLPVGDKSQRAIESCTKGLVELSRTTLPSEKGAEALNGILSSIGLKFTFLTDANAKEYLMNNPNLYEIAGLSAKFLAWATTVSGNFKDYGMEKLLLQLFKEIQAPVVTAQSGLKNVHQALGLAMMLQKFRKEGIDAPLTTPKI